MESGTEVFCFAAQQAPRSDEMEDTGVNPGGGSNMKRARADTESIGRMDIENDNPMRKDMGSFKDKLLSMSCPNTWSGFEDGSGKLSIEKDDIKVSNGPEGPVMKLSANLKEQLHKPWANALILKNMGRAHTLGFMTTKLSQKWSLAGKWHLTDLGEGHFVARFQLKEDLDYVLTNGPWVILNQYLVVQRWKPNFVPGEDSIKSMPIWVRLSKLPIEWMVSDLLWSIGGMLGRMCKVDPVTENQARGRFARICVEIDITKPLLGSLNIDDRCIRVEYESLGLVCFKCGRYGHGKEQCREGFVESEPEEVMEDGQKVSEKEVSPFGPWLLVSYGKQGYRNGRNNTGSGGNGSGGSTTGGNRNNRSVFASGNRHNGNEGNGSGYNRNVYSGVSRNGISKDNNGKKAEGDGHSAGNFKMDALNTMGRVAESGKSSPNSSYYSRKMHGGAVENNNGSDRTEKNGKESKKSESFSFPVGSGAKGSRFEALIEEEIMGNFEEALQLDNCSQGIKVSAVQGALAEITNSGKKQSIKAGKGFKKNTKKGDKLGIKKIGFQEASKAVTGIMGGNGKFQDQLIALRGKEGDIQNKGSRCDGKNSCEVVVEGVAALGNANDDRLQSDSKFDTMASSLVEAMAAIAE